MSRVVTQTAVCLKLDTVQLEKLDLLCSKLGCKRNKLLNFFIERGISAFGEPKDLILTSIYGSIEF